MIDFKDIPLSIRKEALKIKVEHSSIYCLKVREEYFIVRPLTMKEFIFFTDIRQYMLGVEEDFIIEKCVLYPLFSIEESNNMLAGTVDCIANSIVELSGFSSHEYVQDLMLEHRSMMDLADNQIVVQLCKAFPKLDPDDIGNFNIQKLTYYLALAEQISGVSLEFKEDKSNNKKTNAPIDFMADNRKLKDQGFFGNVDPRTLGNETVS